MNFNDTNTDTMTQQNADAGSSTNSTFPLGTGDDGFDADSSLDPLAGAEGVKRSNSGTLLIILVILVAAGGLFSMRTLAKVTASVQSDAEVESSIEGFIATLTGGGGGKASGQSVLLRDDDPTIEVLNESYTERHVPWVNVRRNPFQLRDKSSDPVVDLPVDSGSSDRLYEQRRRAKLDAIESASTRLKLTSVLLGSSPLANINGTILRVGETVNIERDNVTFRLAEVGTDFAKLVATDDPLNIEYEVTITIDRNN